MFQNKIRSQLFSILASIAMGVVGLTILGGYVVAGPSIPEATQSSGWVVQDDTIFGDRIDMVSADDGWMLKLGYHENLDDKSAYLYRWNGNSWSLYTTLPHTQLALRADIDMLSATDGWVAIGGPLGGSSNLAESTIYHWDGTSWQKYGTITAPNAVALESIDMLSPTDGWASGPFNFGTVYYHWDGNTWQLVKQGFGDFTGDGLDMVSSSDGWSVGSGISHWDGADWTAFTSPITTTLNAVSMVSASDGWIVGGGYIFDPNTGQTVPEPGVILHWNGTVWNEVASPVEDRLLALDMVSADDGWIVGENGTILHWDGVSWEEYSNPYLYPNDWLSIDMLTSKSGWMAGFGGVLVYETRPELAINVADGSPGSFFTLTGSDFPANEEATVNINGHDLGAVSTNENGGFTLILSTADADEGLYSVTVRVNPSATTSFVLDSEAPLRPKEGAGTEISVPANIAQTERLFLPFISR